MRKTIWTDNKVEYLKKNFGKISNIMLADELGVSRQSILWKATSLGLQNGGVVTTKKRRLRSEMAEKRSKLGWNCSNLFYCVCRPFKQIKCII